MDLERFDFQGLDASAIGHHPDEGVCLQSATTIRWAGWSNPADVRRDHLRPGDEVEISTSIKRGQGVTQSNVKYLTKRGVRRLLFRSNHPRAIEYADQVLDILDELDRTGLVIDEQRITDEQIEAGHERLDTVAKKRIEERMDYKSVLHFLKLGGAVDDEYRMVQNHLYITLFGMTAARIRATQPQRTGIPRKRGGGFRKSTVAKDFLTEDQLSMLNATVLATIAQIQLYCPNGATAAQMIAAINRADSILRPLPAGGSHGLEAA